MNIIEQKSNGRLMIVEQNLDELFEEASSIGPVFVEWCFFNGEYGVKILITKHNGTLIYAKGSCESIHLAFVNAIDEARRYQD